MFHTAVVAFDRENPSGHMLGVKNMLLGFLTNCQVSSSIDLQCESDRRIIRILQ